MKPHNVQKMSVWNTMLLGLCVTCRSLAQKSHLSPLHRPPLVENALKQGNNLYYFGLGSNMLRSKLENRGINGSKIEIISMEPALVPNHRLAFNMRGFIPLEPGMGSLEPVPSDSKPLHQYGQPECHGALVLLTPDNYEKVMRSEGVNPNSTNPGYEEVVVDAYPYGSNHPVKAVALRARSHVRLKRDPCPSVRYMTILIQGAKELQLKPCYQAFLASHPTQIVPGFLRVVAMYNLLFLFSVSSVLKTRFFSRLQSWLLFRFYVPSTAVAPLQSASHALTTCILAPGALCGLILKGYYSVTNSTPPAFWQRLGEMTRETKNNETQVHTS